MKQLVISACLINYGDDAGGVHHDVGEIVDVPKDMAEKLARADRALYVKKSDDPTKTGQFTATDAMLQAAAEMAKARDKAEKTKDTDKP